MSQSRPTSIAGAAKVRDRAALVAAATRELAADPPTPGTYFGSPLVFQELGAIIVTGQQRRYADFLRRNVWYSVPNTREHVRLFEQRPDSLRPADLGAVFDLRLLEGVWGPLYAATQLRAAPASQKARLRRQHNLLMAFALRDAKKVGAAIRAFIRVDEHKFSLLGYALFWLARSLGIPVAIPKAYDF